MRRRNESTAPKHARLGLGDPRGPSRFYFVVPAGLIRLDEVPEWAGLMEVRGTTAYARVSQTKPAPRLHREKSPTEQLPCELFQTFYYRYWRTKLLVGRRKLPEVADHELEEWATLDPETLVARARDVLANEASATRRLQAITAIEID